MIVDWRWTRKLETMLFLANCFGELSKKISPRIHCLPLFLIYQRDRINHRLDTDETLGASMINYKWGLEILISILNQFKLFWKSEFLGKIHGLDDLETLKKSVYDFREQLVFPCIFISILPLTIDHKSRFFFCSFVFHILLFQFFIVSRQTNSSTFYSSWAWTDCTANTALSQSSSSSTIYH